MHVIAYSGFKNSPVYRNQLAALYGVDIVCQTIVVICGKKGVPAKQLRSVPCAVVSRLVREVPHGDDGDHLLLS